MSILTNPIGTISGWLGQQVPGQPGVGTIPTSDLQNFGKPVPGQPGVYVDSRTGQQYTIGADGQPRVIQAQNLNNQTVTNSNNQTAEQAAAAQIQQQQQQTFAGQNKLAANLTDTITNPNAPSVALSQLGSGFNQIAGTQMATAAGANGENAAVARRTAAQDIAGAQTGLNAQQAQIRAQEVANAQTGLASLYGTQLGAQNTAANTDTAAATTYAGDAEKAQGDIVSANSAAAQANAKANSSLLGTLGSGFSSVASMAG
jgi:hypothetical protein